MKVSDRSTFKKQMLLFQEISVLLCFLQWWAFWICKDFCCCLIASCAIWSWFEFKCTTEDALKKYIFETLPFEHQLPVQKKKKVFPISILSLCLKSVLRITKNGRQTKVRHMSPFHQLSLIRAVFWGQRLEQKHSPLLLTDEIKLSLERPPKSRTLTGKIETILSSECRVTFNYNLTDGSLISWCPFQRWRPGVATRSSLRPRQVLTWFSKSRTKQKD